MGPELMLIGAVASGAMKIFEAVNQSNVMAQQAELTRISATSAMLTSQMELVKGQRDANLIRENLMKTLATQRARFAASGVVLDSGTPATLAEAATEVADRETMVTSTTSQFNAATRAIAAQGQQARASLLDDQSSSILFSGIAGAGLGLGRGVSNYMDTLPGSTSVSSSIGRDASSYVGFLD